MESKSTTTHTTLYAQPPTPPLPPKSIQQQQSGPHHPLIPEPLPSPASNIIWVQRKTKFKPFRLDVKHDHGALQVEEYKIRGTVASAFLKKTPYAHTMAIYVADEDVQKIKSLIQTSPAYKAGKERFRWPFVEHEVKFTSRESPQDDFNNIWDGRNLDDLNDVNLRQPLTPTDVESGARVLIEYTVVPYLGRKQHKDGPGYTAGCTLELLSVGVLNSDDSQDGEWDFDFDSPTKKRRRLS